MAAGKPPKTVKKPAAGKTKKALPSVMGNDPFARGSAVRAVASDAPAAPPPRAPAKPTTPEMQRAASPLKGPTKPVPGKNRPVLEPIESKPVSGSGRPSAPPRAVPPPAASPAVVRPTARPSGPRPFAHAAPPSVAFDPQPHAGTPSAQELSGPTAHAASPSVSFDPQPHAGTPSAQELSGPTAHSASPSVSFDPKPHAGTPSAQELSGPTAHAASPSVSFDPKPHAGTPSAQELSGPTAHSASPSVSFDPKPHAGTPSAQELSGPTAHAASPSVTFDPMPHSGTPSAQELSGPTAHAASPSVSFEATPHAGAPSAEPSPPKPHAHLAAAGDVSLAPASFRGALKGLVAAVRSSAGLSSRSTEVDRWGKDASLSASLRPLGQLLYEKYWRVRVEGAELLPTGPFIIVANHAGALPLDGPVLHLALQRERPDLPQSRWLLEDQVFHAPFVGVLANRLGAVRANPENAMRLLEEGRPVMVFPEGFHGLAKPFSERYQLRRFGRGGYVKIALRAGVPIVPAAIIGGEESMPLLGKIPGGLFGVEYLPLTLPPLPARWHIRFAAPISLEGAPSEPDHDLAWVERKNLAVRDQIEGMLTDLLKHRDSVF